MDTSKEYIEMCEKSLKDIKWTPAVGDYIFRKYTIFGEPLDSQICRDKDAFEEVVILHYLSSVPDYYHGVTLKGEERVVCFKDSAAMAKATSVPLWRQDQLQDMITNQDTVDYEVINPDGKVRIDNLLSQFHAWVVKQYWWGKAEDPKISKEQLWLAFVKHKKFQKVWNGEDWVME